MCEGATVTSQNELPLAYHGAMSPTQRPIRILSLHSFRTNANILEKQLKLANWPELLSSQTLGAEFTFLDAPHLASGPIPDDVRSIPTDKPYREWWNANQDPVTKVWRYDGCDETLQHLEHVWAEQGPFDVILGFSQGAAVAALFSGVLKSKGKAMPKCIVCISGIKVRDERFDSVYAGVRDLPSVHVYGMLDPVKIMTNRLIGCFAAPVILQHERGHVVPRLGELEAAELIGFLTRWCVDGDGTGGGVAGGGVAGGDVCGRSKF